MTTRTSSFEQFLLLFNALKSTCGNDPSALAEGYKTNSGIKSAADRLDHWLVRTQFERIVFGGSKKTFRQVPEQFPPAWKTFKSDWSWALADAPYDLAELLIDLEGLDLATTDNASAGPDWTPIDLDWDDCFHPKEHDLGAAMSIVAGILEHAALSDEPSLHNGGAVGSSAIAFIQNSVGLSFSGIGERWASIPPMFMPASVSNRYGETERSSLYALHEEAARAYVCGVPRAALTLCRAMLERVLRDHYVDRASPESNALKLEELINLAQKKYPPGVSHIRLHRLRRETNQIAHADGDEPRKPDAEARLAVEFLGQLKALIEYAT